MKQQLRKPELWQDFEELCQMLWGEIWVSQETKRNGRNGNSQRGVDVYGVPKEENQYYGIQCKGKDDYTHSQLTEKEVDKEIEKAKTFKPALKKFYFATTANKDADIEEYVRIKDIESRNAGLFEIHLFSWEDIVFLIDQNRRTHDWYVKKIKFKTSYAVKVLFGRGLEIIEFKPILLRNKISYRLEQKRQSSISFIRLPSSTDSSKVRKEKLEKTVDPQPICYYRSGTIYNKSSCGFFLTIENIGDNVIEDYKLNFYLVGEVITIDSTDKRTELLDLIKRTYNVSVYKDTLGGVFKPTNKTLVQNDIVSTDRICFRPSENEQVALLNWELIARDFTTKGQLTIKIHPTIKDKTTIELAKELFKDEVRIENYFSSIE